MNRFSPDLLRATFTTIVVEQASWANLAAVVRALRRYPKADLFLHNPTSRAVLAGSLKKFAGKRSVRSLKGFSHPEVARGSTEHSVEATEWIWNRWMEGLERLQGALQIFFRGQDARFAWKKQLNFRTEQLLEAWGCALHLAKDRGGPVFFIPRDSDSADWLMRFESQGWISTNPKIRVVRFGRVAVLLHRWGSVLWTWIFPFFLLAYLPFSRGVRWRKSARSFYRLGCPNTFGVQSGWGIFPQDLFLLDGQSFSKKDVLVLLHRKQGGKPLHEEEYRKGGITAINPEKLPISGSYPWRLLARCWKASMKLSLISNRSPNVAYLRWATLRLFFVGIKWEILFERYRLWAIWSNEERDFDDAIGTVVAHHYGVKTILIPNWTFPRKGFASAYFDYHAMFPAGHFAQEAFGKTWNPRMATHPVGIAVNDNQSLPEEQLASEKTRRLVEMLRRKWRLVAVFPGSYQGEQYTEERFLKLFQACRLLLNRRVDVCILLKPKVKTGYFKAADLLMRPEFMELLAGFRGERFFFLDPREGFSSSAAYLVKACDLVLSTAGYNSVGSVWVEALMMGKPSFALNPPLIGTPFLREFEGSLLFEEGVPLVEAMGAALDGRWRMPVPDRLQFLFDPFCDQQAIPRIRKFLATMAPGAA